MGKYLRFSINIYIIVAGFLCISLLATGIYFVKRSDYTAVTNHSIMTGNLSRWAAYSVSIHPETHQFIMPETIPSIFARQRIRIYQDSHGIVADTNWIYSNELDDDPDVVFAPIEQIKLPENLPKKRHSIIDSRIVYHITPIHLYNGETGAAVAYSDKRELFIRNKHLKKTVILFIAAAILLLFVSVWLFHQIFTQPLLRLSQNIRNKKFESDVFLSATKRSDEIGDVARAFLNERQRHNELTSDILHELKNPISIIRLGLECLHSDEPTSSTKTEIIKLQHECGRLGQLLNEIRELGIYESSSSSQKTDTKQVIENTLTIYSHQNIDYHNLTDFHTSSFVNIRPDDLGRIIRNLIDNALDFSPKNKRITLISEISKNDLVVTVKDEGMGIPEPELNKIFDRFYSSRSESQNPNNHNGLGLAIVRTLVESSGGKVECKSKQGIGSEFTVQLPLVK